MSKIKVLSENLANQIAAGEVVERPASVVKELVENAIDAGARNIAVQVEGGGSRLIRVIDDGEGMDQDDILLCLERHATSKLTAAEHLTAIQTLGFRGEAISSIASVARLTITSRLKDADLGARAEVKFGRVMKVHEMGCAQGSIIEVRDLFGNVPARKKFLKSVQTELFHIEEVVRNYGLARHALGLTYSVNDREVFKLPAGADSPEQRVRRLLAKRFTGRLIPVQKSGEVRRAEDDPDISGYLLPPEESHGSTARMKIFVNGRAVRDRMVMHAVSEGLAGFLMKGRGPAGVLFIRLPPAAIDVNVHPTKQEVRFHKTNVVHQRIVEAVRRAMLAYQQQLKFSLFSPPAGGLGAVDDKGAERRAPRESWPQSDLPLGTVSREPQPAYQAGSSDTAAGNGKAGLPSVGDVGHEPADVGGGGLETAAAPAPGETDSIAAEPAAGGEGASLFSTPGLRTGHGPLKPMGQVFNSYIICKGDSGLVAIDQHAAQERVIFETLRRQFDSDKVASQALLFPRRMECGPEEQRIIKRYGNDITRLGFELLEFGGDSYVIKAVPAVLAHMPPEESVLGILSRFAAPAGDAGQGGGRLDKVLAGMACKAAIKAGQPLEPEEIDQLLAQMQKADVFSHCPHGRPVVKFFSENDIRKWFHRT